MAATGRIGGGCVEGGRASRHAGLVVVPAPLRWPRRSGPVVRRDRLKGDRNESGAEAVALRAAASRAAALRAAASAVASKAAASKVAVSVVEGHRAEGGHDEGLCIEDGRDEGRLLEGGRVMLAPSWWPRVPAPSSQPRRRDCLEGDRDEGATKASRVEGGRVGGRVKGRRIEGGRVSGRVEGRRVDGAATTTASASKVAATKDASSEAVASCWPRCRGGPL